MRSYQVHHPFILLPSPEVICFAVWHIFFQTFFLHVNMFTETSKTIIFACTFPTHLQLSLPFPVSNHDFSSWPSGPTVLTSTPGKASNMLSQTSTHFKNIVFKQTTNQIYFQGMARCAHSSANLVFVMYQALCLVLPLPHKHTGVLTSPKELKASQGQKNKTKNHKTIV